MSFLIFIIFIDFCFSFCIYLFRTNIWYCFQMFLCSFLFRICIENMYLQLLLFWLRPSDGRAIWPNVRLFAFCCPPSSISRASSIEHGARIMQCTRLIRMKWWNMSTQIVFHLASNSFQIDFTSGCQTTSSCRLTGCLNGVVRGGGGEGNRFS